MNRGFTGLLGLVLAVGMGVSAYAHDINGMQKKHKVGAIPFYLRTHAGVNANVQYYGGPVISNVKMVAVFWGQNVDNEVVSKIGGFYSTAVQSPYIDWLSEYSTTNVPVVGGATGSNQTIGRGSFVGNFTITPSNNGTTIDDTDIQAEVKAQITAGHLPAADSNTVYMFHFPPNLTITMGNGGQVATSCQDFCAYHGTTTMGNQNVMYGVLPDLGGACAEGCGNSATMFDNFTTVASHETIEAITDPAVGLATDIAAPLSWYDTDQGEIGDMCQTSTGTVSAQDGTTYTVQGGWSQKHLDCISK